MAGGRGRPWGPTTSFRMSQNLRLDRSPQMPAGPDRYPQIPAGPDRYPQMPAGPNRYPPIPTIPNGESVV
ncbi:hypothetical protein B9Z19DRAFT_665312 [Tuber borchii]|uniref:Uncharacterized protein n=1 Tax=Tuber borchii TaxID=42251 RepID=A0A2T6ZZY0_TUBBO|nr:hypothetical protein B9Z19DRAFT_665312 [Tuber borchii]